MRDAVVLVWSLLLLISSCGKLAKEQIVITPDLPCEIEKEFFGVVIGDMRPYEKGKKKRLYYFSRTEYCADGIDSRFSAYFLVGERYKVRKSLDDSLPQDSVKLFKHYLQLMKKYGLMKVSVLQTREAEYQPEICNAMTRLTFYADVVSLQAIPDFCDTSVKGPFVEFIHNYKIHLDTVNVVSGNWVCGFQGYASY